MPLRMVARNKNRIDIQRLPFVHVYMHGGKGRLDRFPVAHIIKMDHVRFLRYLRCHILAVVQVEQGGKIAIGTLVRQKNHLMAHRDKLPPQVPYHPLRSPVQGCRDNAREHNKYVQNFSMLVFQM